MTIFGDYSHYYDLLYRDKDYTGEARFIHQLIQDHVPNSQSILELGCGTGRHACLLAELGYSIQAIDQSVEMLAQAQERTSTLPKAIGDRLMFKHGDIREIELQKQFDVVLALFHVISYQTSNQNLFDTFTIVKNHLKPGGIFIFDVWYGPAVLSDPPVVRVKRLEDEKIKVARIAEPVMYPNENLVDVHYDVFITSKLTGAVEKLQEKHTMRYLFKPELESTLSNVQLKIIEDKEWLTRQKPGFQTWNVYFVVLNK
jgi:SAM-dependent methyltransferase